MPIIRALGLIIFSLITDFWVMSRVAHIIASLYQIMVLSLFMLPDCFRPSRRWRLNPLLLADKQFTHHISSQTSFFLEINTSPEISHLTLWETLKAYFHGQIIEYSSRAKKIKRIQI